MMDSELADREQLIWTDGALKRLERAPLFLRGMVKKLAERKAREIGVREIREEDLVRWKDEAMGRMGGEVGLQEAAAQMEKGGLPWTREARERLEGIPEFVRGMVKRIAEDVARERGHLEVNTKILQEAEALGDIEDSLPRPDLPWTPDALRRLERKGEQAPEIARDFVLTMLKRDAEDLARQKGYTEVTDEVLTAIWDAPAEEVGWTGEAWKRLQTSPDFVRSGIKKAAERRARKMGVKVITSELLTKFRNEAMMRAVKRIRAYGFNELTFDAFEVAKQKTKRLKENPEAHKRLDEIREYMGKRGKVGLLDHEMLERMREYLKDPTKKEI